VVSSWQINTLLLKARDELLAPIEGVDRNLQRLVDVRDSDHHGDGRVLVVPKTAYRTVGGRVCWEGL